MKKALRINIAEPCHENWQNMTPQEQGRHCGACCKTVVDFTMMSDQEVLNYLNKGHQDVCGRFNNDQLNKDLVETPKPKRFSFSYFWSVLLATLLITETQAQVKPKPKPKKEIKPVAPEQQLMGMIVLPPRQDDEAVIPVTVKGKVLNAENNEPVTSASIQIKGVTEGTQADMKGSFSLEVKKKRTLTLEISAVGYEPQTKVIDALSNWSDLTIYMKPSYKELHEVVVIAPQVMGKIVACRYPSNSKVETVKADNLKKPAIVQPAVDNTGFTIYPNPVVGGNSINANLTLKQAGKYKLELLNAAGQVLLVKPLIMHTTTQLVNVPTQAGWSAGVYWLRISAPGTKNVYQAKVILQQ